MDALKFFKEWNRMCSSSNECAKCPFNGQKCDLIRVIMEEHIAAVEQWSKEHPRKTRQDVFLEQYPGAWVDEDGCLRICPNGISPWHRSEDGECITADKCADCRREFWMQEVE